MTRSVNAVEHYLDRHVDAGRGNRAAIRTHDEELTFAAVLAQVERAAGELHETGVRASDRVAIILPDVPAAVVFLLASMRIGAIPAPLHVNLSDHEYAAILDDCRPAAAVVSAEHSESIAALPLSAERPRLIVVDPADPALDPAEPRGIAAVRPDDAALLQYTSGTTGLPKGVVHRHDALLALPDGFARYLDLGEGDLCFSAAKLFFGYGLGNSLLFPFDAGIPAFLRAESSDPVGCLETINEIRPTVFFGGPALYTAILALAGDDSHFDLSSVRLFVSAGEALSAELFEAWMRRFGTEILDGLGATECLHIFAAGRPGELRPGRLGGQVPPHELRIVAADGTEAALGEAGLGEVRGPSVSREYWNRPEESGRTMVDGWVKTGDLMRRHPEGGIEFLGRDDDVFKVRGMKVAPIEVEQRINAHPAVKESAVVGRPDRHGIQVAHAVVTLMPGHEASDVLAQEIRAAVRSGLARHKAPRSLEFVDALPRSSTGKIARYKLRDDLAEGAR